MTRQNTEKKRTLSRLLVVLAALALLSFCFLGTTFGRYTTGATGSGSVGVALWDIEISGNAVGTNTFTLAENLSPDADQGGAGTTNSTGYILIATIKNNGEVNASVTFEAGANPTATLNTGVTAETDGYNTYFSQANTNSMFSIAFFADDSGTALSSGFTLAAGATQNIYARVTWTTIDDLTDTWYGMNVASISWGLTYTAVQNSELPG